MKRKTVGTFVLAGVVVLTCSAGSGGCGGSSDRGVSAPAVGAGGEQSAPKGEPSSVEETPNRSHDAQPRKSPSDEPSEPAEVGEDPCNFSLGDEGYELAVKDRNVKGQVTVGPCVDQPKQYSGTLSLIYTPDDPPGLWKTVKTEAVYTNSGTTKISASCKEGWWIIYYVATGRDENGNSFTHPHGSIPKDITCPNR